MSKSLLPLPKKPKVHHVQGLGTKYYAECGFRDTTPEDYQEFTVLVHAHSATEMDYQTWKACCNQILLQIFAPEVM